MFYYSLGRFLHFSMRQRGTFKAFDMFKQISSAQSPTLIAPTK